jgi:hypothetical protein
MASIVTKSRRADMMVQGVRDLFAAGWLGEQAFAQLGLHRAVSVLEDPGERTKVIGAAWRAERPFGRAIQLGLAGTSLVELVRDVKRGKVFDIAASACALGALAAAIGCEVAGSSIGRAQSGRTPIASAFSSHDATPASARKAQSALKVLVTVGLALGAASIGLSIASRSRD